MRDKHLKKIKVVVHRIFKCSELNQDQVKKILVTANSMLHTMTLGVCNDMSPLVELMPL